MKHLKYFFMLFLAAGWVQITSGQVINMRNVQQSWATDTTNHIVPLNEFRVLLKRDAIKPIDHPVFIPAADARDDYFPNEPVCVVQSGREARAYPLSVLLFHEIVNDQVKDLPVAVTYCPLCNSVRTFDRRIPITDEAVLLDFGTSGMLRKSNLVMWDRQSETWWQQFTAMGIVGKYAGITLPVVPSMILAYRDFLTCFPEGKVLQVKKGEKAPPYGKNPYYKYDSLGRKPRLYFGEADPRLPAMERVVHLSDESTDKIYPYPALQQETVINDRIGATPVVIFYRPGMQSILDERDISKGRDVGNAVAFHPMVKGKILTFHTKEGRYYDDQTGSEWNITGQCIDGKFKGKQLAVYPYTIDFAFALFAFYPDVPIYEKEKNAGL